MVTYGSALPAGGNSTFLSFKSGKLGGRAIFDMVHRRRYSQWLHGWRNFNAGHEHPDQNSFTFAPDGVPFITEALYGPKYTLLNNAVLFSAPLDSEGGCFSPWSGQLTEACDSKWLKYKSGPAGDARGRVEAAMEQRGVVLLRGEASAAYSPQLGVRHFQRNLLLLQPQLLLLLDHVQLEAGSRVAAMSAFFHNTELPFRSTRSRRAAFVVSNSGQRYHMLWADDSEGASQQGAPGYWPYPRGYPYNGSNYVNVTTLLRAPHTRAAYVFHGPGVEVRALSLRGDERRVDVHLATADHTYTIYLLTTPSSSGNGGKSLLAMVLRDGEKIVFEQEVNEDVGLEEEVAVEEVEEYVNLVEDNLQHVKPVFQQMERHILGRVLNAATFSRSAAERLLRPQGRGRRTQQEQLVEKMFAMSSGKQAGGRGGGGRSSKLAENPPDIFAQIEASEKQERQRAYQDAPEGGDGDAQAFIDYSEGRRSSSSSRKGAFVRGRKFKEVRGGGMEGGATAASTGTAAATYYVRLFLLLNTVTFFLLLAVILSRFQRGRSLHTQRCFYTALLIDCFILLYLYSSCSHAQC